ncbi:MAG: SsrA-binding protein SmpB [Bacteroidales bacterium]|nr:SsrA-binding protein SmpB [Bacteroidales bacterium]MBR2887311.1 SsrA-binding protein SmpB [Bacteroidales bacterium]MDD6002797.1 SsrA-binding protein SmpB [Bacteroidales bacterium]
MASELNIKNKKASFQYEFLEKYVAGIQLLGTEIKSIRDGKAALTDSYCSFTDHELYVKMYIGEYSHGGYVNHDPRRERKLLLQRKELNKLEKKVQNTGLTIVPLRMFLNKDGKAKLEIALCRGKKMADKREDLKSRDNERELSRIKKIKG